MKTDGDGVVVHGLRSRPSNRRIDEQTQVCVVELLKQPKWCDFGPTFASQQLAKRQIPSVPALSTGNPNYPRVCIGLV